MTATVYLVTNRINGKTYVGVTSRSIEARRKQHLSDARRNVDSSPRFHMALRKYGEQSFEWQALAQFGTAGEARRAEIDFITVLKPEYNVTAGGQGAFGVIWTPERRARHSAIRIGMKFSDEHRANLKKARARQIQTPEMIKRRADGHRGKPLSAEHRAKISASLMGHPGFGGGRKKNPEAMQ